MLINVLKLKHIKSWSLLFCLHFETLARRLYSTKITCSFIQIFHRIYLSQELDIIDQVWVEVEGTKLRTNFKCRF